MCKCRVSHKCWSLFYVDGLLAKTASRTFSRNSGSHSRNLRFVVRMVMQQSAGPKNKMDFYYSDFYTVNAQVGTVIDNTKMKGLLGPKRPTGFQNL